MKTRRSRPHKAWPRPVPPVRPLRSHRLRPQVTAAKAVLRVAGSQTAANHPETTAAGLRGPAGREEGAAVEDRAPAAPRPARVAADRPPRKGRRHRSPATLRHTGSRRRSARTSPWRASLSTSASVSSSAMPASSRGPTAGAIRRVIAMAPTEAVSRGFATRSSTDRKRPAQRALQAVGSTRYGPKTLLQGSPDGPILTTGLPALSFRSTLAVPAAASSFTTPYE
jgi:hypothetical protein